MENNKSEKEVQKDISKIINAKNVLHNQILDELEIIIKDNSILKMKGGSVTQNICNGKIKMLGTIVLPTKTMNNDSILISNRLDTLQKSKPMSLSEAMSFLNDKISNY